MESSQSGHEPCEWFAVQVWAGRERLTVKHLSYRGYDVFYPCYMERRRRLDRVANIERALFAGYLFCRMGSAVAAKIVTTPGVVRVVGDGRRPVAVDDGEIQTLQRIIASGVATEPWSYLSAGQRIRIDAGPLSGTDGIVLRVKSRYRLVVSVSLLQRSVSAELDADWVTVLPQSCSDEPKGHVGLMH